jgi:hypothetical protein
MTFLTLIARILFLRRLFGSRQRASRRRYGGRYPATYGGRYANRYGGGFGGRRPGTGGFGFFGPVPYYSRRTRGGGRVSVGGCCLPIPLALGVVMAAVGRLFLTRR